MTTTAARRESQYLAPYLATTASGRLVTPGTYLAGELRGRARIYSGRYLRALEAALRRRMAEGTVRAMPSLRGGTAYIPA
jgi:hypothetical protein